MRSPPSIDEWRAFCRAARTLNFSAAARELNLTPSAVSRRIARAEEALDRALFLRVDKRLELTAAGRQLLTRVGPALQAIETACMELALPGDGARVLSLACVPTFTTRWLVPRLPAFLSAHPGITLSFRPHLGPGDRFPEDLDVAVRYGDGVWAGVNSDYIDGRCFIVVAAPSLAERLGLRQPRDLRRATLLRHAQASDAWTLWAREHMPVETPPLPGPQFEQYAVLIQAVISGLGVALVPAFLVGSDLASGALVEPVPAPVNLPHGHHLCIRPDRLAVPQVQAFRKWLLGLAGRDG